MASDGSKEPESAANEPQSGALRLAPVARGLDPQPFVAYWRINGHPARLLVWTLEQWSRLERPPDDAQYLGCGVWCALRVD